MSDNEVSMNYFDFRFAANTHLYFGAGKFKLLPKLINNFGENLLLVLGGQSFKKTSHYKWLLNALENSSARMYCASIQSEPSPNQVDEIVQIFQKKIFRLWLPLAAAV